MDKLTKVYIDTRAAVRLRSLSLTEDILVEAVLAAELERRSCSPLEPSTAPGFKAWAAALRRLGEQLVPLGWVRIETKGLPRYLNPETSIAVAVLHGDEGTGYESGEPKSKTPRGEQSIFLVRSNEIQLKLFEEARFRPLPAEQEQITWWLLIHSTGDGVLRAELSLPVGLGEDGRMSIWEERIVLKIPEFDPASQVFPADEEHPFDIEVKVRPKKS